MSFISATIDFSYKISYRLSIVNLAL